MALKLCAAILQRKKKGPRGVSVKKRWILKRPVVRDSCPSRVTPRCLCFVVSQVVTAETHHRGETEGNLSTNPRNAATGHMKGHIKDSNAEFLYLLNIHIDIKIFEKDIKMIIEKERLLSKIIKKLLLKNF